MKICKSGLLIIYLQVPYNKYNTWYAFYVKTVVVFHEDAVGAISDIIYAKSSFGGWLEWLTEFSGQHEHRL